MLRVCLTGGIASGKSLVTEQFAALGVRIADSDEAAREVVLPGSPGLDAVVETFGREILAGDGSLDRRALRQRVFADDNARKRLEKILHPLIRARIEQQMEEWAGDGENYALQAVPLLVETGMHRPCGHVLVVDAPETVQIQRLTRRDGESVASARAIIERQASRWERLSVATDVVDNGDDLGPETGIAPQVHALHAKYTAIARFDRAVDPGPH